MGEKSQFPLYRRPGSVVFIDDEHDYLDMIGLVMPSHWQVELFMRPQACLDYFQSAMDDWTADLHEQQQIIDRWHQGTALVPQLLAYWRRNKDRYALPRVLVVDYAMPAMNGLALLERLSEWTGACVLLSGRADEHIAVNAFNRGLLEQFIPKQTPDIARRVHETVARLLEIPNVTQDQFWRSTLNPAQLMALRQPAITDALRNYASSHWVESVMIGCPFGILGLDEVGQLSWLQLEFSANLDELAELAALQSVPKTVQDRVTEIRSGNCLTDVELQQSVGRIDNSRMEPAFNIGSIELLGALFQLNSIPGIDLNLLGYRDWQSHQGPRMIQE